MGNKPTECCNGADELTNSFSLNPLAQRFMSYPFLYDL